jgi:hypothetical protein
MSYTTLKAPASKNLYNVRVYYLTLEAEKSQMVGNLLMKNVFVMIFFKIYKKG